MNIRFSAVAAIVCAFSVVGAYGADEENVAQVYEMTITVKTTQAKKGKVSASSNPFVDGADTVLYRKQSTEKWRGLVWGCSCEAVLGLWQKMPGGGVAGAVVWNTSKPYDIVLLDNMSWHVLNAIGLKGNDVECAWTIGESTDSSNAFLAFSGFGTLALATEKVDGALELNGCGSNLKSARGSVAGWIPGPFFVTAGRAAVCTFCGVSEEGTDDSLEIAEAWMYCPCSDIETLELTSVSGSWTISYNAKLSKSLMSKTSILDVYSKFPSSVKTAVAAKIAEVEAE